MKKSIGSMLLLFVILTVLVMSGCAPAPTPEPTSTPVPPTFTPEPPTFTPEPTMTPTVTPTPLPPGLTDGTYTWLVLGVSFLDTVNIEGYDKTAENGKAYLLIEFESANQGYPVPPTLPNSNKFDYSQIYVTDSLGNKYFAVDNGVKIDPIHLYGQKNDNFVLGNVFYLFEAMPKESHGFTLYFLNFPPVELGK